jgi:hypothetical protein
MEEEILPTAQAVFRLTAVNKKLSGLSPLADYTDRRLSATLVPTFTYKFAVWAA